MPTIEWANVCRSFRRSDLVTRYCWYTALRVNTARCSSCRVRAPEEPVRMGVHGFDGFCYIPERLQDELESAGYERDPVIQRFVGIAIELVEDLHQIAHTIAKPKGNNTLRRWSEVFRLGKRDA